MCVGDFNDIFIDDEKDGGKLWDRRKLNYFQALLDDCGFIDLPFKGKLFTWFSNKEGLLGKDLKECWSI